MSLAQFKRDAIVGSKWHTVFHPGNPMFDIPKNADWGIRTVAVVKSKEIGFNHINRKNEPVISWLKLPKKEDFSYDGSVAVVSENGIPILTYTRITE